MFAAFLIGLSFLLSTPSFPDAGSSISIDPSTVEIKRNREIGSSLRYETEIALRKLENFDIRQNKILTIVKWNGSAGPGVIVAVREGAGKAAGCAIYEKIGNSEFEFVNGQPFCYFFNRTGSFKSESLSVRFDGKIRQSCDSPAVEMWFELHYDERKGVFCDSSSRSNRFKCGNSSSE